MLGRSKDKDFVSIGNCSGFYGDRKSAMLEMLTGGDLDVITGDYLAELTMLILARQKQEDPDSGYAKTFLQQLEECLEIAIRDEVKIVVNAGGMNPRGLAGAIEKLAKTRGIDCSTAFIEGDDVTDRAESLGLGNPLAANAYLGGFGISEALKHGADVVVTGRVTDASLIVGAAAWFHRWSREDYDEIAGAMAAGHVIECGTQATGGNFSFFKEIENPIHPGFPIARIHPDGSSVITKHPGTNGAVTRETVLAQLLYEVQGLRYGGPDAVLRLDSLKVEELGKDQVLISGAKGELPPTDLKVSVNEIGGYRNEVEFLLTGLDIEEKAALLQESFDFEMAEQPEEVEWTLVRNDRPNAEVEEEATAILRLVGRDKDPHKVGRSFSGAAVELLFVVPGLHLSSPPQHGRVYGRFTPAYIPQDEVEHIVHLSNGESIVVPPPLETEAFTDNSLHDQHADVKEAARTEDLVPRLSVPFGRIFGTRSGDKGGNANIGVWARNEEGYKWLRENLTVDLLCKLLPELADFEVGRIDLPNLGALNFVVTGILGEGVAYGARFDPQAKGIGEWLRARRITVPTSLIKAAKPRLVGIETEQPKEVRL